MTRTTFQEVMEGTVRLGGRERPIRLELGVDLPEVFRPWGDTTGVLTGRVEVPSWADDRSACGTLRVAPIAAHRIRYRLDFTTDDGRPMHLDGWKSVSYRHPLHSMTHLPATITDDAGEVVGEARLRFNVHRDLAAFLTGFRLRNDGHRTEEVSSPGRSDGAGRSGGLLRSRWRGQAGRLEVWYTTLTDPATGTGVWIHHELVAPSDGRAAYAHGWAVLFPPGESPVLGRFGPHPWTPSPAFAVPGVEFRPALPAPGCGPDGLRPLPETVAAADSGQDPAGDLSSPPPAQDVEPREGTGRRLYGQAGPLSWDLAASGGGAALYTFPRWAWERELLPASQVVSAPTEVFDGTVRCGDRVLDLRGAPGATARIYGHGNARRWAWLHADLGDGDVCEVVAAVSTRRGLDRLPPLPFVRLRLGGTDWPTGDGLLAAARMRARIGLPSWTVSGRSGDRMIRVEVTQPPGETIAVDYTDPDGSPAVCHNSERADAVVTLLRRAGRRWELDRRWHLNGTAHAEVGLR